MATGINQFDGSADFSINPSAIHGAGALSTIPMSGTPGGNVLKVDCTSGATVNVFSLSSQLPADADYDLAALVYRPAFDDHIVALGLVEADSDVTMGGLRNNPDDATLRNYDGVVHTLNNTPNGFVQPVWTWIRLRHDAASATTSLWVWPADMGAADFGASAQPATPTIQSGVTYLRDALSPALVMVLTATPDRYYHVAYLSFGTAGDAAPLPSDTTGGGTGGPGEDGRTPELRGIAEAEGLRVQWKYTDEPDTGWRSLGTIFDGDDGMNGRTPTLRTSGGVVQWKYIDESDTAWRDLFTVPTGAGTGDGRTPELRVDGDFLQWKYTDETAWTNLYDMLTLVGPQGEQGPAGPAPEMRTNGDAVEWKHTDTTTWSHLFDIPAGGDGTTTVINVIGRHVSNKQMDIQATSDPVLGRQRLQEFVDNVASDNVTGYIDAALWAIDGTIFLPPGIRLVGRGMEQTVIDCPTGAWSGSDFYAMRLTAGLNGMISPAFYLSDFRVVGADKTRSDNGPLVRLDGVRDGVVERMAFVDPSSYGLFVSGYGLGGFTNDIEDDFWNSTHQVSVRDCRAIRGQIGFGTEGGAEHVLFQRCISLGNPDGGLGGLHGYRSASGYGVTYDSCWAIGYRNGFLIDRHRDMTVRNCLLDQVRNGIALGSFYSDDPAISTSTRIVGNKFRCNLPDGRSKRAINDSYIGNRVVNGVTVADNFVYEGDILLLQAQRMSVHDNIDLTGGNNSIITGDGTSGRVHDNLMNVSNSSSSVTTSNNGAV